MEKENFEAIIGLSILALSLIASITEINIIIRIIAGVIVIILARDSYYYIVGKNAKKRKKK